MSIKTKALVIALILMIPAICRAEECDLSNNIHKYVPYHEASVVYAIEITESATSDYEKYEIITTFVSDNIIYDYIRAIKMPAENGLPDLDYVWNNKRGVCLDIASLTTGMLRVAGVNARLCIGTVYGGYPHAWVEAVIDGTRYIYDHGKQSKSYYAEIMF